MHAMPDDLLTIIIVSFNSASTIIDRQDALCCGGAYPVIIVDNASPDASAAELAKRYPGVTLLAQDQNIGYGRGANVGLRACTTPYALLLNPDITADKTEIDKLLGHMKQAGGRSAICGPATSAQEHRPDAAPTEVDWLSGCAMLFNVAAMREIGLFDENIFLYSEETELCHRVGQSGYSLLRCDDVLFEHETGTSSGSSPAVEYLRWWHFGWSNAYRMTKHDTTTLWKNPRRKMLTCRLQSLLTRKPAKKLKWRAKADGFAAYVRGEKAFNAEGEPMMLDQVKAERAGTRADG